MNLIIAIALFYSVCLHMQQLRYTHEPSSANFCHNVQSKYLCIHPTCIAERPVKPIPYHSYKLFNVKYITALNYSSFRSSPFLEDLNKGKPFITSSSLLEYSSLHLALITRTYKFIQIKDHNRSSFCSDAKATRFNIKVQTNVFTVGIVPHQHLPFDNEKADKLQNALLNTTAFLA